MQRDPTEPDLRDCGHVGHYTGVCQYQGCAKQLCATCIQSCEACGIVLCPPHQDWIDGRVFCTDHAKKYRAMKLVRRLTPGL